MKIHSFFVSLKFKKTGPSTYSLKTGFITSISNQKDQFFFAFVFTGIIYNHVPTPVPPNLLLLSYLLFIRLKRDSSLPLIRL